jgi:hypothetical protein
VSQRSAPESMRFSTGGLLGLPDLKFINRKIRISEVARALDLRIGDNGNIHCWRLELHQNGDRSPSVGIRKTNNTVKCFGCGIGPLGPVDLESFRRSDGSQHQRALGSLVRGRSAAYRRTC